MRRAVPLLHPDRCALASILSSSQSPLALRAPPELRRPEVRRRHLRQMPPRGVRGKIGSQRLVSSSFGFAGRAATLVSAFELNPPLVDALRKRWAGRPPLVRL